MRLTTLLIILLSITASAQSYRQFETFSATELLKHKDEIPTHYYQCLLNLISKRDTMYLKKKFEEINAKRAWIVEGFNFEKGEYGIFEVYCTSPNKIEPGIVYLNRVSRADIQAGIGEDVSNDRILVDIIPPRQYEIQIGDLAADEQKARQIANLDSLAKKDGIVIEKYCRIETVLDNATHKIFVKFLFPVPGQRKLNIGSFLPGWWPSGLEFWLFNHPKLAGSQKW